MFQLRQRKSDDSPQANPEFPPTRIIYAENPNVDSENRLDFPAHIASKTAFLEAGSTHLSIFKSAHKLAGKQNPSRQTGHAARKAEFSPINPRFPFLDPLSPGLGQQGSWDNRALGTTGLLGQQGSWDNRALGTTASGFFPGPSRNRPHTAPPPQVDLPAPSESGIIQ